MSNLSLSVIVPVRNGGEAFGRALAALSASALPRAEWELVVVDDGSTDDTADVASHHADLILRLDRVHGPAHARNRGAERARAAILAFVDADVCVHPDALERLLTALRNDPSLAAVFGAYDATPGAPSLISQYRNLLHHYVHTRGAGRTQTFWAGCGAIRRDLFMAAGMFDERRYPRPCIEDIELGYRLTARGESILLDPRVQGTHLKRWTLGSMLVTDFRDRAVPWMRLILARRTVVGGGTLNIRWEERFVTTAAAGGVLALAAALVTGDARWLLGTFAAVVIAVAATLPLLRWLARERGVWFALGAIPLRLLFYLVSAAGAAWGIVTHLASSHTGTSRVPPQLSAAGPAKS